MTCWHAIPQGLDKASAIGDDQTTSQSVLNLNNRMSSEGSDVAATQDMERMHINNGCGCEYAVEYDEFLTTLQELTATPATTLKAVLSHMREKKRHTSLLERCIHQCKSLDYN